MAKNAQGSTIKSIKKAKGHCDELVTEMNKYYPKIAAASASLNEMMKGDGTNAFWQGQNAYNWYKKAADYINNFCENYQNSYEVVAEYAKQVDRAWAKAGGARSKALLAQYNGYSYISKIQNKDAVNVKLGSQPLGTVNVDSANDDLTQDSMKCYRALKQNFEELCRYTDTMEKTWGKIKQNTGGSINKKANTRINALNNRQKQIQRCISELDADYIGDVIFSVVGRTPKA